jgi:hypothetical protein
VGAAGGVEPFAMNEIERKRRRLVRNLRMKARARHLWRSLWHNAPDKHNEAQLYETHGVPCSCRLHEHPRRPTLVWSPHRAVDED